MKKTIAARERDYGVFRRSYRIKTLNFSDVRDQLVRVSISLLLKHLREQRMFVKLTPKITNALVILIILIY